MSRQDFFVHYLEEMADDMEALEFETAMQNLRQAVYNDL